MRPRSKGAFAAACLSLLGLLALTGGGAPAGAAQSFPGEGFLPQNRAWEMVSPADKNGGYVVPDSRRTFAADDGDAIGFMSLAAFGDAIGAGVNADYIARRSTNPNPGNNGWSTHAITPYQDPNTLNGALSAIAPLYVDEFSGDLQRGVFFAKSALTDDPNVEDVLNLYRRTDLRSPGAGSYELITACPRCAVFGKLPPLPDDTSVRGLLPLLGGASPDLEHVVFESEQRLTTDTPAPFTNTTRLYEWDPSGAVRLAGKVPAGSANECTGGACAAAPVSVAGQGQTSRFLTPHTVSDGSDGHTRVFFTVPTDAGGAPNTGADGGGGNVYVGSDAASTAKLNATDERGAEDPSFARAFYWDATPDGARVVFSTARALTDDAPIDSQPKLYMYDTTKLASAPDNLTLLSPPGIEVLLGAIGLGADGDHVYFVANDTLYMWHEGNASSIAPLQGIGAPGFQRELLSTQTDIVLHMRQARVTPDGRHLLFGAVDGAGLTGYDHGVCDTNLGSGCRELYLYDAEADSLQCVSCRPDGGPSATVRARNPVEMSSIEAREFSGGAKAGKHETNALSEDGRYAFFSTAQKLVPEDTNGIADAYMFDSTTGEQRLLSSGTDSAPSFFLDASPDGSDVFFATRERLSAWDVGNDYDLYDARAGGGFPEPSPPPPSCEGDACQPAPLDLNDPTPGSASVNGPGNPQVGKPRPRCPKGKRRVKTRAGKSRCVKRSGKRAAKTNRRAGR